MTGVERVWVVLPWVAAMAACTLDTVPNPHPDLRTESGGVPGGDGDLPDVGTGGATGTGGDPADPGGGGAMGTGGAQLGAGTGGAAGSGGAMGADAGGVPLPECGAGMQGLCDCMAGPCPVCPAGGCSYYCFTGTCAASCPTGDCDFLCSPSANCSLDCGGGKVLECPLCTSPAGCPLSCTGSVTPSLIGCFG